MTKYKETQVLSDDAESVALEALAHGNPHVFIVASIDYEAGGGLDLKIAIGGGVQSSSTLRNILNKTLAALPDEE